ncbi:MAG: rRNA m(7)G-527 methyltransferase [Candidatus Angelobacter sp.]|jgi:16S rRNA (guanine527-N7)-methyltransferase|nr:rRNA m(7)G-527 methyltransferase [Candidatus Angelobacter sp.]
MGRGCTRALEPKTKPRRMRRITKRSEGAVWRFVEGRENAPRKTNQIDSIGMDEKKISELLEPYLGGERLGARQLEQVSAYLALLLKWNAKMNLTAVREPEEMVSRHFGESLFAARLLLKDTVVGGVIDLGSGAGFPGLPLAIYAPQIPVTLIESQNKKATFLKEVVRALDLKNVKVFGVRGEDFKESAELVTMRAVEKFEQSAVVASGMVSAGGRLALLIGEGQVGRVALSGFEWVAPAAVPKSAARVVLVGKRVGESS